MSGLDSKPCQVCGNYNTFKYIFTVYEAYYCEAQRGEVGFANRMEEKLALIITNYDNCTIYFIKPN